MHTQDTAEGLHMCREFSELPKSLNETMLTRKKVLYCFYKKFLENEIIRQMNENAVYLHVDQNRFS